MGLTVHYSLHAPKINSPEQAVDLVLRIRRLTQEMLFEEVDDVRVIDDPVELNRQLGEPEFDSLLYGGRESIVLPWSRVRYPRTGRSYSQRSVSQEVRPTFLVAFETLPSEGCAPAQFGLALMPSEVETTWRATQDKKYLTRATSPSTNWYFDEGKWGKHNPPGTPRERQVTIKYRQSGWRWSHHCKTEYSSEPEFGGLANFLRGHVALVTMLERANKLPGLKVTYNDEGHYGKSYYTDDPRAEKRVYTWHPATFDVPNLIRKLGESRQLIAVLAKTLEGLYPGQIECPYLKLADDQLTLRPGDPGLRPFLEAMKTVAERERTP